MKGGRRSNAGRPGWHPQTSTALQLDIRSLNRKRLLAGKHAMQWRWPSGSQIYLETDPENVRLEYGYKGRDNTWHNVDERICVAYTTCHFGGKRPWFVCPKCQRRAGIMYLWYIPQCRNCAHLVYASQSEDPVNRSWRRTTKIESRLASGEGKSKCRRPKGMHMSTYQRLMRAYAHEQINRDEALIRMAGRMGWLDL